MHSYWHVILESLIDTAKVLPILFLAYYLIELLEYKFASKMQNSHLLKGNASPIFGSLVGCVPQCGFSVVSADLFSKGIISVGALIAVYIATSDEAIPLMITHVDKIPYMVLLIGIKIVFAVLVGYIANALYKLVFKKQKQVVVESLEHEEIHDGGCCHHHVDSKNFDWLHPLLHSIKIGAFILIINILFGMVTHIWVGEDRLTEFLNQSLLLQPLLAVLIGLIPNCASSVCLTELFLVGGLNFGALVAGLCVNAGLGMVMLLKQNKNIKENLFIFLVLIISSLIIGYGLLFIF